MQPINPATLRAWIMDGHELAILDAREEGEFATGRLFWAVSCPLSRRELRASTLLTRLSTRIVTVDDGRGLAQELAAYLEAVGCRDVYTLTGGAKAWEAAGYRLFFGVHLLAKAFAGWVEHHYGTQNVSAEELKFWLDARRNVLVLDSRPYEDFTRATLPIAVNVPLGELAYRIGDLAPDPKTTLVILSAGRARGILGAETLRRAGVPNRVMALSHGIMGWELAGYRCEHHRTERYANEPPKTAALALSRAQSFAESCGVGVIGALDLVRFEEDSNRTCYVLDVRHPAEFRAGHRPGSRNAPPGGDLLFGADDFVAVRNSRIVLLDDTGVRARMTGAWLRQMGCRDVFVVEGGLEEARTREPPPRLVPDYATRPAGVPTIDVPGLTRLLAKGDQTVIVDLARSLVYREGHIPGALWGIRTRLAVLKPALAGAKHVVLTSPDGLVASLAVEEMRGLTTGDVRVLEGGTEAWHAFGRPYVRDPNQPPDKACIDVFLLPHQRCSGVEQAMRDYLAWEARLPQESEQEGTVNFGVASE
ncbi:MAG: thiosulfate sulfurtransferase [Acetobacteraceae bacterium]|nr:thiosulfate sulfurtransferase [Acetobacteraceae bacterium]